MFASVARSKARSIRVVSGQKGFPGPGALAKIRQPLTLSVGNSALLSTSNQNNKKEFNSTLLNALEITAARVCPSDIGWQLGAETAIHLGLADTIYMSGLPAFGSGVGVVAGGTLFYLAKKIIAPQLNETFKTNFTIPTNEKEIIGNAAIYGMAATISGTVMKPAIDILQSLNYTPLGTSLVTGLICGVAFNEVVKHISRPLVSSRYPEEVKKISNITDKHVACGMYMSAFLRVQRPILPEAIPL
tara:strand:+ start:1068 stop:1802 length:735 start_codon:yes stop_codon:yes gene_type:complete